MATCEHLPKAPIQESLLDIRVELPAHIKFENLAEVREAVSDDYPKCRTRRRFTGQLSFGGNEPSRAAVTQEGPDGYLLTSKDGLQVMQARLDGYTFSRLHPYQEWEKLRDEARRLWELYRDMLGPSEITRVAVRYINRIEIPTPVGDLKQWILTGPEIARDLPQELDGYFFRVHLRFEQPKGFANITQHIDPTDKQGSVSLILDIDVFLPVELSPSDPSAWDRMEELRTIKNRIFFESITDKLKELFK